MRRATSHFVCPLFYNPAAIRRPLFLSSILPASTLIRRRARSGACYQAFTSAAHSGDTNNRQVKQDTSTTVANASPSRPQPRPRLSFRTMKPMDILEAVSTVSFNPASVVPAVFWYAKLGGSPTEPKLVRLLATLERQALRLTTIQISTLLVSCRVLDAPAVTGTCVAALCRVAMTKIKKFDAQSISNSLNALAIMAVRDETAQPLVALLADAIVDKAASFTPQAIGMTLRACVVFNVHHPAMLRAMCEAATKQIKEFDPEAIANTLYALAFSGHYDGRLVSGLCREGVRQRSQFKPQHIATTLYSLGSLDHYSQALFTELSLECLTKARYFEARDIAKTILAMSKFNHYDADAVDALSRYALHKADSFDLRAIADTLRGLHILRHPPSGVRPKLLAVRASLLAAGFTEGKKKS